jgi:tetratricopeptide (TPR) repeat protein
MPQRRCGGILVAAGFALLTLGGCAGTPLATDEAESAAAPAASGEARPDAAGSGETRPEAASPSGAESGDARAADGRVVEADPVRYRPFDTEALFDLLVAELALRRGDLETAAQRYVRQARATRDPGVVASAARIAAMAGDEDEAGDLARLWAELAPRDPRARQAAALALIRTGRFEPALEHLAALRELGSEADFGYLAVHAADIPEESRHGLLRALAQLAQRYPDDRDLAFARAVLLERSERPEEALAALAPLEPGQYGSDAILLRARLLDALGDGAAAVDWLRAAIERGGEVGRLRYMLARLLVEQGRLDAARVQFERLLERVGENSEILLSLALISLEAGDPEAARDYLQRLLRAGGRPDAAHYYLGVTASEQGRTEAALDAWRRVGPGFEYERAQASAASLALSAGDPDDLHDYLDEQRDRHPERAIALWMLQAQVLMDAGVPEAAASVLDAAIEAHPGETDLLYARAMAHDTAGDAEGMIADLERILELDPDDAMALNALGYTLADRNERLDEARALVERALATDPEDPAFIDSLGWVEFRQGNHDRAVELLRQAWNAFRNHEVAAHLGEALWVRGDREAAREIWARGLQLSQETDVLIDTIERLLGSDGVRQVRARAARNPEEGS